MQVREQTLADRLARTLAIGAALFGMAPAASAVVTIDWVTVGNPGNAADSTGFGAVADTYRIATHEVTNAQYAEFLNAKAASDPLGLYNTSMGSGTGGITRSGVSGSFTYSVIAGRGEMPVNYVSFYDTLRFANWLNNGQGAGSTETGAYTLLGGTATPSNGTTVTRNAGATIFLTSEAEWYKAAYYSALSTSYFDYPAGSDTQTTCATPTATANRANCDNAVGNLTNRGSYTGSTSPYGTFDQGGNVWEWNEAIISGSSRGIRGGSFVSSAIDLAASTRDDGGPANEFDDVGFRVASLPASLWTPVGNPGNAADNTGFGAVGYGYNIGTYEVTNAQYAEFLNAKAAADPLGLYNTNMGSGYGGITRSGSSGSYTYSAIAGRGDMPVNFVSFYDTLRFANWLHNGQGAGDTETGAYTLLGGTATPSNGTTVTRNAGATIFLTSEDEWYKAAYYNALSTSYFDYPAGSDTQTTCAAPTATANRANCSTAVGNLTNRGSYTASASPYGTFDQGGNVWEWNEAIISGSNRGRRGGAFGGPAFDLAASTRSIGNPALEGDVVGFRVASLPEPGRDLLLMTGVLGLACCRKRRT